VISVENRKIFPFRVYYVTPLMGTGVGSGVCTGSDTTTIYVEGILNCIYWDAGKGNLTAQNTRKPFGGRGSAPDPAEAYSAPANPLVVGEGLDVPSPKTPSPRSRPFGPRLSYLHSKISSDADADGVPPWNCVLWCMGSKTRM